MMQSRVESPVRTKMEKLRLVCEKDIPIQHLKINSYLSSFRKTIDSIKAKAQQTVDFRENIGKLKDELKEREDDLVKALAAKTKKEAERIKTMERISATRARVEELKKIVEDQKARKNEFAEIMPRQHESSRETRNNNKRDVRETEKAISWYNKILGFQIECGHGVKFIFTNIDLNNPSAEYSFSVRYENDLYTLLECDPQLKDLKEAMHELNKSNDLFKFIRIMRENFLKAAAHGNFPQRASTICVSTPDSSAFTASRSESMPILSNLLHVETNESLKKVTHGRIGKAPLLSPLSTSSLRRSPRFKVKK